MKVLVLGATGATGKLVVQQLLEKQIDTKAVVRDQKKIPDDLINNSRFECVMGNISEFNQEQYSSLISDCDVVISCLGHNISFQGVFGEPKKLVTNCVENICDAIMRSGKKDIKFLLMNTTANRNIIIKEKYGIIDKIVLSILYHILPPQRDNVEAAIRLVNCVGVEITNMEWVIIRPDTLIDEEKGSEYEVYESPKQSPVFNSRKVSRINVASFMIKLILDEGIRKRWRYKMPVVYNRMVKS